MAPVPGRSHITATFEGATFAFATEGNRDAFLADPAAYMPRYDGHCSFGVSRGVKTSGNPLLWRIDDGALYFNGSEFVYKKWQEDIRGNVTLAEANWFDLEEAPASTDPIGDFDAESAPVD